MTHVRARLVGHPFDLETLANVFPSGDPRVFRDGDEFWVESSRLDAFATGGGRQSDADSLRDLLNAAGRLQERGFEPVEMRAEYVALHPDGSTTSAAVFVTRTGVARARGSVLAAGVVTGSDGETAPGADVAERTRRAIELASTDPAVAGALYWLARPELDWVTLWKAFEVVESTYPPRNPRHAMVAAGLTERAELNAFAASANDPRASGLDARHAMPQPGREPRRTMTIEEGRAYVSALILRWAEARAEPDDPRRS